MSQNQFQTDVIYPGKYPDLKQQSEQNFQTQRAGVHHFLVIESNSNRYIISLESSTYSIGRDLRSSIVLTSKWVSRHHAILLRIPDVENNRYSFRIIDGDLQGKRSKNGLWVNGNRCFSHSLNPGDTITFGKEISARYYLVSQLSTGALRQASDLSKDNNQDDDLKTVFLSDNGQGNDRSEIALFRLASFPELIPTSIIEVNFEGTITYINPAALKRFPDLQENKTDHPLLADLKHKNPKETRQYFVREICIEQQYFQQYIHYIYESDLIRSYIFDITEYKRSEASLRKSEAKNRALLNAIPDLMLQVDCRGKILDFKPAKDFEISSNSQIIHRYLQDLFPPSVAQQMSHYMQRSLHTQAPQVFEYELPNRDSIFHYEVRLVTSTDDEILIIIRNITERKLLEKQLIHDAFHDALTGLPNRPLFMNHLAHVFQMKKRREHYLYAVLFIDLDRFKVINDSLGHLVGDRLLIGIARRLEHCLRPGDTVARLGGDEFAILLEDIASIEEAIEVADHLQQELAQPFYLDNQDVFTTASIGIAPGVLDYHRPEELLRDADIAMYHAKSLGKARYEVFDRSMHARVVTFLQLDSALRRAIERQEFQLYYQPIVSLQSGLITGFETLVRWQHPEQGLVSPEKFIQIAEETGLIIPIGEWILYEACYQAHQWHQRLPEGKSLNIAINLSGKQFAQPHLVQQIDKSLCQSGLDPRCLKLEITESVLMETSKLSTHTLHELKALNLDLCIDDFGTGYSSLSYLHHFPIDILKADRSFVSTMGGEEQPSSRNEIARTIVMLAHNLGIQVVAEGVETVDQLAQLRQLGCEYGQGFFFSRPLSREDAEALILKQPCWSLASNPRPDLAPQHGRP